MNWKIDMLELVELGLLLFVLWIPFRMGRAKLGNVWCILVGWPLLVIWAIILGVLSIKAGNLDSDHALPDGQIGAPLLLFGWLQGLRAAALGRNGLRENSICEKSKHTRR